MLRPTCTKDRDSSVGDFKTSNSQACIGSVGSMSDLVKTMPPSSSTMVKEDAFKRKSNSLAKVSITSAEVRSVMKASAFNNAIAA